VTNLQAGLARLHGISSTAAMLDKATQEACQSCGFDRSILLRVWGGQVVAQSAYFRGDPAGAARLLDIARRHPEPLDRLPLEAELVRRRTALRVADAQGDPRVHQAIATAWQSRSYVAAPIMPSGNVIGVLQADRHFQERDADELDRALLWAFAEGFGFAYQRTVLVERMRQQREQVRELVVSVDEILHELTDAAAAATSRERSDGSGDVLAASEASPTPGYELLTPRELEVITLMAAGETNGGIGNRLALSPGTVKTHIKNILRKLGAANRAQAVSRFLTLGGDP